MSAVELPPVTLRYFASAREAAGTTSEALSGRTVGEVLSAAVARHGPSLAEVLECCRIWVNGEPALFETTLDAGDEVAVLPPVSGGSGS
jgi:molybdopterin synthase catalytic subunit/molybdopterin synthase sulfur carrier subunit